MCTRQCRQRSISGFRVKSEGRLQLLDNPNLPAQTACTSDMAFSHDGPLLFSLNNGDGTISAFGVNSMVDWSRRAA